MASPFWTSIGCVTLTLACFLFGGPVFAQPPAPQKASSGALTFDPAAMKPWTGDLDGMLERRVIRVLTVNNKTFYFIDKGVQRGIVVDYFRVFEDELNKKLAAERKLKDKSRHRGVEVVSWTTSERGSPSSGCRCMPTRSSTG